MRLKPVELSALVQYAPAMLRWLRKQDSYAGDLFLDAALDVEDEEVHTVLAGLLKAHNETHGVLAPDLKERFDGSPAAVWARAVHTLFTTAMPAVVGERVSSQLAEVFASDPDVSSDVVRQVTPVLASLELDQRDALYELCTMIRDTAVDPECTALAMASSILRLPHADGGDGAATGSKLALAALVEHAELMFGKEELAKSEAKAPNARKPAYSNATVSTPAVRAQRRALRDFFLWRDKRNEQIVTKLFANFDFADIARGVSQKYDLVPVEWKPELERLKAENPTAMAWYVGDKAVRPKRFSLAPRLNRRPVSKPRAYKPTQVDRVIDEIIATEVTYHDTMLDLVSDYVTEVQEIADGKYGEEARLALGLEAADVESVFGARLANVRDVSEELLSKLDLVALVPTEPRAKIGRAGLVGEIFEEHAQELRVYAPYISSHMGAMQTLKAAVNRVEKAEKTKSASSARKILGAEKKKSSDGPKDFVTLWFTRSQQSARLKGHTLESILILPVQRVPRYKLLLETLLKEVPKVEAGHPSLGVLQGAFTEVKAAAMQINTAVKQHMKLQSFFGKDRMISPNSSIARKDEEGNFLDIVNSYVG